MMSVTGQSVPRKSDNALGPPFSSERAPFERDESGTFTKCRFKGKAERRAGHGVQSAKLVEPGKGLW